MRVMKLDEKKIKFLATGGYSGYAPFVSGTFGTLAGLPLCFIISLFPFSLAFLFILAFILLAVWIADQAEKMEGSKDPGWIVIDEIAGILITMAALPFTVETAIWGFFIFRGFDIVKPFPVRFLERNIDGGAGVVVDDVAAGIMSNIVLRCVIALI